MPNITEKYLR